MKGPPLINVTPYVKRPRMHRDRTVSGESNHELDSIGIRKAFGVKLMLLTAVLTRIRRVTSKRSREMYRADTRESCRIWLEDTRSKQTER